MKQKEQLRIFEQWLGRYKGLIFKTVRTYAFNATDRDDLFQEISIQVWNSIPSFRQMSSVSTWIYRISLNTAIKWARKEQQYHQNRNDSMKIERILQENRMPTDERLEWLYDEISKLDEIDRSVTLLLLDAFTYREMAEMLGITESNVGVRINRIKKRLIAKSKKTKTHGI